MPRQEQWESSGRVIAYVHVCVNSTATPLNVGQNNIESEYRWWPHHGRMTMFHTCVVWVFWLVPYFVSYHISVSLLTHPVYLIHVYDYNYSIVSWYSLVPVFGLNKCRVLRRARSALVCIVTFQAIHIQFNWIAGIWFLKSHEMLGCLMNDLILWKDFNEWSYLAKRFLMNDLILWKDIKNCVSPLWHHPPPMCMLVIVRLPAAK